MRAAIVIAFAIAIDFFQAVISAGLFIIAAFPGTTAGTAAGCYIGQHIAGSWGCWAVGALLGAIGTWGNVVAPATIPIGVMLGFAVNICISATFGLGLIILLWQFDMLYLPYVFSGGIMEFIPGIDDLPGWTTMTILCVVKKMAEDKAMAGNAAGTFASFALGGFTGGAMAGITSIKQANMATAARSSWGPVTAEKQVETKETQNRTIAAELKNIDGIRRSPTSQQAPVNDNVAPQAA